MYKNQHVAYKTIQPFSFDTLKASANASVKVLAFETLNPEDVDACLAVDYYFQKCLGYSIFSDVEHEAIEDALSKHGLEYLEIN